MSHHIHGGHHDGEHATLADSSIANVAMGQAPAAGAKVCCACGESVSGRKRYKDSAGHYWCEECARADSMRKHPAACADCQQMFPGADLVDHEGARICSNCWGKRLLQAKRAAARVAAVEEETRQQHVRRQRLLIGAGAVLVAALLVYGLVRLML